MKAYTDLEQSKKLAEILPIEGADMFIADVFLEEKQTHSYKFHFLTTWGHKNFDELKERENKFVQFIPCWSLAALLGILANETHNIDDDGHIVLSSYKGNWWNISPINCISEEIKESNNPLDAAFEMVVRLLENKNI